MSYEPKVLIFFWIKIEEFLGFFYEKFSNDHNWVKNFKFGMKNYASNNKITVIIVHVHSHNTAALMAA